MRIELWFMIFAGLLAVFISVYQAVLAVRKSLRYGSDSYQLRDLSNLVPTGSIQPSKSGIENFGTESKRLHSLAGVHGTGFTDSETRQ